MPETTTDDGDRIERELGEHGDTRTVHPRLVCTECGAFVYLTHPREFADGAVRAECDCRHGDPTRGDLPDAWMRIHEYPPNGRGEDSE